MMRNKLFTHPLTPPKRGILGFAIFILCITLISPAFAGMKIINNGGAGITTAEKTKLEGIETGAQVNPSLPSQAEAEAGTSTTARSWSVVGIIQAFVARLLDSIGITINNLTTTGTTTLSGTTLNPSDTFTIQSAPNKDIVFVANGTSTIRINKGTVTTIPVVVLYNEYVGVSYYGTTSTTLWTGTVTGGLMGAGDTLEVYADFDYGTESSKSSSVTIAGINMSSQSGTSLATATVGWSCYSLLINKGSTTSNFTRNGASILNGGGYTGSSALTTRTIDTRSDMALLAKANMNNLAGTVTLQYIRAILYKKP